MNKYFVVTFKSGDIRFYTFGNTYYYFNDSCPTSIVVDSYFSVLSLLTHQGHSCDIAKIELAYC